MVVPRSLRPRGEHERRETGNRAARMVDWPVPDPVGQNEEVYRAVAAQIEGLVMRLILELRSPK